MVYLGMEKKWKLLKDAYDKYPKDTKCQWGEFGGIIVCTGEYHFADGYDLPRIHDTNDYAIFDGEEWADIIMEKPERKFIMKSEDGVDLYHKDNFYWTVLKKNGKYMSPVLSVFSIPEKPTEIILFSTKEAAEKWIEDQNKIKLKSILGYVSCENKNYIDQYGRVITPEQIEEIYLAQTGE